MIVSNKSHQGRNRKKGVMNGDGGKIERKLFEVNTPAVSRGWRYLVFVYNSVVIRV